MARGVNMTMQTTLPSLQSSGRISHLLLEAVLVFSPDLSSSAALFRRHHPLVSLQQPLPALPLCLRAGTREPLDEC